MKEYTAENIRNIAFLGHSGSGKSTLAETILYNLKVVERLGKASEGTLTSDYDPEEIKRQISINTSIVPIEYNGIKINILDCPGNRDFIGEIKSAAHVADGVLVLIDASGGIEVGTEFAMEVAEEYDLPVFVFINKLDKENTDFAKVINAVTDAFGKKAVPLTFPVGKQAALKGVIDLLKMKAIEEKDRKVSIIDIPADLKSEADAMREAVVEAAAEGDDSLMEKFFEQGALSEEEVSAGLKKAFIQKRFIPVLCGSVQLGIGIQSLLDFAQGSFPNPLEMPGLAVIEGEAQKMLPVKPGAPFSAYVFKTVSDDFAGRLTFFKVMGGSFSPATSLYNFTRDKAEKIAHIMVPRGKKQEEVSQINAGDIGVVAKLNVTGTNDSLGDPKNKITFAPTRLPQNPVVVAVQAKSSTDEDKVGMGLHALMEQDPTLRVERDPEVHQTLLSGMGDQHLDVAIQRLRAKSKVEVEIVRPKIRYRETVTKLADGSYRHKKQSGGRGQFAEVFLKVSPLTTEDFEFKWTVFGGAIPTNFSSAVEKGVRQALEKGILAGYRVVGVLADCYDGKHHPVDSSDMAFQIASSMGFQQIAAKAGPIILEPIDVVTTTVPEQYMGDVMGDMSQRRGRIQGTDSIGKKVIVRAQVPEAELQTYSQDLRSMTGGRGVYERVFSHYDPVPREIQEKVIEEARKSKEEEE